MTEIPQFEQLTAEEEIVNFTAVFPSITPLQKRIYRYVQWYCRTYTCAFPSHARIAKICRCHRDTVIQALKKFRELGWLHWIKRAYKSSIYIIGKVLLWLDISNPKTFRKKKPTSDPTSDPTLLIELDSTKRNVSSGGEENPQKEAKNDNENVQNSKKSAQNKIPYMLNNLPLSQHDKKMLSRYTDHVLNLAIETARTYQQKGFRILNLAGFLTWSAKDCVKKRRGMV